MSRLDFIARMKRFDKNAEIIFDEQEPIGAATDLVMPCRGWFGAKKEHSMSPLEPVGPILP